MYANMSKKSQLGNAILRELIIESLALNKQIKPFVENENFEEAARIRRKIKRKINAAKNSLFELGYSDKYVNSRTKEIDELISNK